MDIFFTFKGKSFFACSNTAGKQLNLVLIIRETEKKKLKYCHAPQTTTHVQGI